MNILIDEVPEFVEIDGVNYEINTDFRISIMFELLMQDNTLTEREKIETALNLYYPDIPPNIPRAIEKMLWFYRCGKDIENTDVEEENKPYSKKEQIYSFKYDDELIFAAYLSQYGINLQRIDYLHWWEFKALFKGLEASNRIVEIMNIRSMEIDGNMSKEQKRYYRKLKELYKLPDNRTEEEKELEFQQTLSLF